MPANRVRTIVDTEFELEIEPDFTVAKIKELAQEKADCPPQYQTLVLKGQKMSDEKTASEYGLENGAKVQLILAIRG